MDPTNELLRQLPLPPLSRLAGRIPNCSWCGRTVDKWGDTCDRQCWSAWTEKILPLYGKGDVVSSSSVQYPPLPDTAQPWYTGD